MLKLAKLGRSPTFSHPTKIWNPHNWTRIMSVTYIHSGTTLGYGEHEGCSLSNSFVIHKPTVQIRVLLHLVNHKNSRMSYKSLVFPIFFVKPPNFEMCHSKHWYVSTFGSMTWKFCLYLKLYMQVNYPNLSCQCHQHFVHISGYMSLCLGDIRRLNILEGWCHISMW